MQLREGRDGGGVLRILRQHGGVELGGAGCIALRGDGIGLGQKILRRARADGPTRRSMKPLTWLSGRAPMKPSAGWPRWKAITAGNRLDAELAGDLRVLVDVHLDELDLAAGRL